ncbi:MAG: DUF448 domain-containing protein [Campylobacterales bacterium]
MCIVCRQRFEQRQLFRLQCADGRVVAYQKRGRSFYICPGCVSSPKISKQIARNCRIKEPDLEMIAQAVKESIN